MTSQPKIRVMALAVAATMIVFAIANWLTEDGLFDELLVRLNGGEDTCYAKGYSRERFNELRIGDTEAKVRAYVGDPLEVMRTTPGGETTLVYSMSPHSTNYRLRELRLKGGVVVEKIREMYID